MAYDTNLYRFCHQYVNLTINDIERLKNQVVRMLQVSGTQVAIFRIDFDLRWFIVVDLYEVQFFARLLP